MFSLFGGSKLTQPLFCVYGDESYAKVGIIFQFSK